MEAWALLLGVPVTALVTLSVFAIRNRLGYEHWRMRCPRTAYPYPPAVCTCRCTTCRELCKTSA